MSVLLIQTTTSSVGFVNVTNTVYKGEAFRAQTAGNTWGTIDYIVLNIGRYNNPGNAVLKVYSTSYATLDDIPIGEATLGAEVGSVSLDTSGWNHNFVLDRTFTFGSPISVSDGVYFVTLQCPTADATNYIKWRYGSGSSSPSRLQSIDSGSTWTNASSASPKHVKIYGTYALPSKATTPAPANAATDVTLDQATVTWVDGGGADTYNVYYGTTSGALGDAVSSAQAGTSFTVTGVTDGSPYDYIATRYWRIDSTNAAGTTTGDEWSFTTIRFKPPAVTYFYNGEYYQLLIDSDGDYGAHPYDGGVEDTDYVVVTYEPNFISTTRKLVGAANGKIWFEDI